MKIRHPKIDRENPMSGAWDFKGESAFAKVYGVTGREKRSRLTTAKGLSGEARKGVSS